MKTYTFSAICLFAVLLLCIPGLSALWAQKEQKIQLLDATSGAPIASASFEYGAQRGLSGESGHLVFHYTPGTDLVLSHVSYGKWTLNDREVQAALALGSTARQPSIMELYPLTIIALRPAIDDKEVLELGYKDRMAHDGGAILNQGPAINSIRKSGNYGFDPVMRGFKYDQLNIVVNGAQSATAACPNRMDPPTSQVAPNMMDRIEVLKGPHALRYGSAFGGTINFVPSPARFTGDPGWYGRLSAAYESNGNIARNEGQVGFHGQSYDLSVFGSWSQGNDYEDGESRTVPAEFLRNSFGARLGVKLRGAHRLTFTGTRNAARDVDFPALPMDLREDDTWMFNARHETSFQRDALQSWNTTVYGTFVDHLMNNFLKSLDPRTVNAETAAKTRTYGGRTEGIWKFGQASLFAGADLRVEEAEGSRVREFIAGPNAGRTFTDNAWQNGRIIKSGFFAEYRLLSGSTQFVFSSRLEVNDAQISSAEEEFTRVYPDTETTQVNPSLSLGGVKSLGDHYSVGLWLGRAQRSGGLTERYINYFPVGQDPFEMLGNPQLDPEINNQLDLTVSYERPGTIIGLDLFAAYLQDYISSVIDTTLTARLPNSPGVRQFINIGQAWKTGFELSWSQALTAGLQHQVTMAYTYGQDLEREEPLPEIAPLDLRYKLTGSFFNNKLQPQLVWRYVADQQRVSDEFGETSTPSFTTLDATVSYHFSDLLRGSLGIQNIFDETYYEHLNRTARGSDPRPIFAPGRNVFVSLSLKFM